MKLKCNFVTNSFSLLYHTSTSKFQWLPFLLWTHTPDIKIYKSFFRLICIFHHSLNCILSSLLKKCVMIFERLNLAHYDLWKQQTNTDLELWKKQQQIKQKPKRLNRKSNENSKNKRNGLFQCLYHTTTIKSDSFPDILLRYSLRVSLWRVDEVCLDSFLSCKCVWLRPSFCRFVFRVWLCTQFLYEKK